MLIDRAFAKGNITIKTSSQTTQILSSNKGVSGIEYRDCNSNKIHRQELSGVFVQIGLVPNSKFIEDIIELNKYGEIIIDEMGNTSVDGIFACGDVTTVPYKQIIISMGEGAKAAIAASEYLQN